MMWWDEEQSPPELPPPLLEHIGRDGHYDKDRELIPVVPDSFCIVGQSSVEVLSWAACGPRKRFLAGDNAYQTVVKLDSVIDSL